MAIRSKDASGSAALRQALELAVVTKLIDVLFKEGCLLSVDNLSDAASSPSKVKDDILNLMGTTDEESFWCMVMTDTMLSQTINSIKRRMVSLIN
jgi:hypothetical protein